MHRNRILNLRGEREGALRIYQEEELPVYERIGDTHSRAVTIGKIAEILLIQGKLELGEAKEAREDAERMGILEAEQIAAILEREGLDDD